MRANNGDHLHRYAGSSGGGGRGGREGEAYIVGGVGSGSDSSPWISCSAVRTISVRDAAAGFVFTSIMYGAATLLWSANTAHPWWSL